MPSKLYNNDNKKGMFFRKYLAFVETTFPCVFCCFLTWWADRLFVEFGHRATDSPTCTQSDLQYVRWHQMVTGIAVAAQILYSVRMRRKQFNRELTLVGVIAYRPWLIHLYLIQTTLCIAWATVVACLVDVSPWLCLDIVLQNRAGIAAASLAIVFAGLVIERKVWGWTLDRAIALDPETLDI